MTGRRGICRRVAACLGVLLAAGGVWFTASALFIPAKALVAQILLRHAWEKTLAGGEQVKPWPWADTWPVARLRLPDQNTELIVLAGATGQALAFGPGHVAGTAAPGTPGISVIGGHRDTHLRPLAGIARGDRVEIQRPDGKIRHYRVDTTLVADARKSWRLNENAEGVVLVTCYPFGTVASAGSWRYLVQATVSPGPRN